MHSTSSPVYRVIILTEADASTAAISVIMADSHNQDVTDRARIPMFGSGVDVLDFAARHIDSEGEITLICDRVPTYVWDDQDDAGHLRDLVEFAKAEGWAAGTGAELGSGWITWTAVRAGCTCTVDNYGDDDETCHHPGAQEIAVHMGIRRMMPETDPMIKPDDTAEQVAVRLARYAALVGAAYRAMPGVAGMAALRNLWERPTVIKTSSGLKQASRRQPRWRWDRRTLDAPVIDRLHGAGDLNWRRPVQEYEKSMPFVVALDVRAMYLAAAAGVMLGHDQPANMGAIPFDATIAGFWRIDTTGHRWARPETGVPVVNPGRIRRDGSTWVTTPVLRYLNEIGATFPEILDSWVSDQSGKWLESWAKQIRDALPDSQTTGDPHLRASIKSTYVEAIAMMSTPTGRIYRPDWTHLIRDEARMRLIRKVHKANRDHGVWPLRVKVDCVWYPTLDDNPSALLTMLEPKFAQGWIGQFRPDKAKSGTMAAYLTDIDATLRRSVRVSRKGAQA